MLHIYSPLHIRSPLHIYSPSHIYSFPCISVLPLAYLFSLPFFFFFFFFFWIGFIVQEGFAYRFYSFCTYYQSPFALAVGLNVPALSYLPSQYILLIRSLSLAVPRLHAPPKLLHGIEIMFLCILTKLLQNLTFLRYIFWVSNGTLAWIDRGTLLSYHISVVASRCRRDWRRCFVISLFSL